MVESGAIRLRAGELRDLPLLESIERETATMFPPSVLPPSLAQPMPQSELAAAVAASLLWVAESASAGPVGFIVCESFICCLHVREMDVRPRFGRRGIGARLLLQACSAARSIGFPFVTLTTFSHLAWNAPFYAKHGFAVVQSLERFPHLEAALRHERDRGLENRVAMARVPE